MALSPAPRTESALGLCAPSPDAREPSPAPRAFVWSKDATTDLFERKVRRPAFAKILFVVCFWISALTLGALEAMAQSVSEFGNRVIASVREPVRLEDQWLFRPGDDPAWAAPDPAEGWRPFPTPAAWGAAGYPDVDVAWYRYHLRLTPGALGVDDQLGVSVGAVSSAYELFADGRTIGRIAGPPPDMAYDRRGTWAIPRSATADGEVVLAFRVWRHPAEGRLAGGIREDVWIGLHADLHRRDLQREIPQLVLACLFFAFGLYHFQLFAKRRQRLSYFWLGLFLVEVALYTLLRSQLRFSLSSDFVLFKELEHLVAFSLAPLAFVAVASILDWRLGLPMRLYAISHPALGLFAFLVPGLEMNLRILAWWPIYTLAGVLYLFWIIAYQALARKRPEARTVGLGAGVMALCFGWDQLAANNLVPFLYLSSWGTAVFAGSLAFSLADRFHRVHQQLDRLRSELEQRVETRTRELEAARVEAEAADRAKGDFLANISHEIRTPVHAMRRTIDRLKLGPEEADAPSLVRALDLSSEQLMVLIDDILTFSEVEAEQLAFEIEDCDPRRLVESVVAAQIPRARAKGIGLSSRVDERVPERIRTDPSHLSRVILHLVGNAVKFTDRGRVDVRLDCRPRGGDEPGHELVLGVRDTGIGIESEVLERLFLPFSQADSSPTRRHGGTGMGLVLSQRLAGLAGGRIEVDSRAREGSTFRAIWPYEEAGPESGRLTDDSSVTGSPEPSVDETDPVGRSVPPRVLVVDDDEICRMLLEIELEARGIEPELAENGQEALDLLAEKTFDLVLMDCQMPVLDGYSATRRLRREEAGRRHTPVVAVTAHAMAGDREKCLSAGMDDYLAKPYTEAALRAMLATWLPTLPRAGAEAGSQPTSTTDSSS